MIATFVAAFLLAQRSSTVRPSDNRILQTGTFVDGHDARFQRIHQSVDGITGVKSLNRSQTNASTGLLLQIQELDLKDHTQISDENSGRTVEYHRDLGPKGRKGVAKLGGDADFATWAMSVAVFFGGVYSIGGILYFAAKANGELQTLISRQLKSTATEFARKPHSLPALCTGCLFGVADIFAQFTPSYWGGKTQDWDWCLTIAVAGTASLLHGFGVSEIYRRVDERMGGDTALPTLCDKVMRMFKLQGFFLVFLLPVLILLMGTITGFVYQFLNDNYENCGLASIAGLPGGLLGGVELSVLRFPEAYVGSFLFWPPSHAVNYVLVRRWCPEFRTTFDGITILAWNVHLFFAYMVMDMGHHSPLAAGPVLFGSALEPASREPLVDCKKWCLFSQLGDVGVFLNYVGDQLWDGYCTVCDWIFEQLCHLWSFTHRFVLFVWQNGVWCIKAIIYYLMIAALWVVTIVRLLIYAAFRVVWKFFYLFLSIWDFFKSLFGMFFLPALADKFAGCPYCALWPEGQYPKQVLGEPPHNNALDPYGKIKAF